MIVHQGLTDDRVEAPFTESHHPIEGFLLHRAHEPCAMGVEMWAPRWEDDRLTPAALEQRTERWRTFGIPLMDARPFPKKEPVEGVGQRPGPLRHEGRRGMRRDTGNLHASCGQFHDD